tara:strand:- start:1260 stop:1652 length:393 start_codon:yes stop_codon:yes gene_type:complete
MENLDKLVKQISLRHDDKTIQSLFQVTDDQIEHFGKVMNSIQPIHKARLSEILEAVLQQNTYNTLEELICFVFVAGMGTAEAKHIDQMEGMRRQVADLAIGMRKESIKPEDIVSKEQLEKIINDTKEDEF